MWRIANGRLPIACILALGAVLYICGIDWGIRSLETFELDGRRLSIAESGFHPDSNALETATASLSRSIYPSIERDGKTYLFSSYGPVFMYLWWAGAHLAGPVLDFVPFGQAAQDTDASRLVGRAVSAAAGLATILLTYILGLRAYGKAAGLLAAFLLAVMPMAIQAAHFATVDGMLATGAVWICLHALGVARKGQMQDYILAGVAVGVTTAVKLNGALIAVAVGIAHLQVVLAATPGERLSDRARRVLFGSRIWISAACALGVYLALDMPVGWTRHRDSVARLAAVGASSSAARRSFAVGGGSRGSPAGYRLVSERSRPGASGVGRRGAQTSARVS